MKECAAKTGCLGRVTEKQQTERRVVRLKFLVLCCRTQAVIAVDSGKLMC